MIKAVMNNILKSNDIEAKKKGKYEQERDILTIRDLMNIAIRKINDNIRAIKSDTEIEIFIKKQVERECKIMGGNRNKKLRKFRAEVRNEAFVNKCEECTNKINNLVMKYGKADPKILNDEKYLKDIKWRDEDLRNVPKINLLEAVTIVGDPTENEIEALALGPKFCLTPKLTNEDMEIALAENKVKRI